MKSSLKVILQNRLGFHRYLVLHSLFVALTMRLRRNEGSVLRFIAELPEDATVLDIGANVGTMSLLFARRCKRGRVIAFEPIPENYRAAAAVLRSMRARNVQLFQLGAGERDESVRMVMPTGANDVRLEGLSHVVAPGRDEAGTRYDVQLVALDTFPATEHVHVSGIKIDVEDHERFVLRGATRIIERDRPLIYCELWGAQNKLECFELLTARNYEAFVALDGELVPYDAALHRQINFLFVPRERITLASRRPGRGATARFPIGAGDASRQRQPR